MATNQTRQTNTRAPQQQPAQQPAKEQPATTAVADPPKKSTGNAEVRVWTYKPYHDEEDVTLSVPIVQQFFAKPTAKGNMPSLPQMVQFIMTCVSRKLNPWLGDCFLVGYDGHNGPEFSTITAHVAFLKRAENHPQYAGMESGVVIRTKVGEIVDVPGDFVDDTEVLIGGWARVHRKDREIPVYRRLRLSVFNKDRSQWKTNPAGMICKCAESDALRSAFPNHISGMFLDEELRIGFDMPKEVGDDRSAAKATMDRIRNGRQTSEPLRVEASKPVTMSEIFSQQRPVAPAQQQRPAPQQAPAPQQQAPAPQQKAPDPQPPEPEDEEIPELPDDETNSSEFDELDRELEGMDAGGTLFGDQQQGLDNLKG